MPSESLGMLAAAIAVVAILAVGITIMAAQSYTQRQLEAQALQNEYNTQLQYMVVAGGANPAAGWWPNQPGIEADGGTYTYYTSTTKTWEYTTYNNYLQAYTYWYPVSQPRTYRYTTYTSAYEPYTYQVPRTETALATFWVSAPHTVNMAYETYTQGWVRDYYYHPVTTYVPEVEILGWIMENQKVTMLGGCGPSTSSVTCGPYSGYVKSQYTGYYPINTWSSSSFPTYYYAPYNSFIWGSYTVWGTLTGEQGYPYYESQPYTYQYTTYNTYVQPYTYTYYTNTPSSTAYNYLVGVPQTYTYETPQAQPTQMTGTAYLNQTIIENGEYQLNYTNTTYTYYETTGWNQNTGTYYPTTQQETGYAPTTTSIPQTVNDPYLYSVPQTNSAKAYSVQTTTRYYETWTPYPEYTGYYSYQQTNFEPQYAQWWTPHSTQKYTYVRYNSGQLESCPWYAVYGCFNYKGVIQIVVPITKTVYVRSTFWESTPYIYYYGIPHYHNDFVKSTEVRGYPYRYKYSAFNAEYGFRGVNSPWTHTETIYNTVYQPETGYYWASAPQTNYAPYDVKGPPVSVGYTYTNATLTLTNGETYIVGIVYANPDPALGVYYVPLSNPEAGDTAAQWLLQQGWQPMSPQQWSNWEGWSTPPTTTAGPQQCQAAPAGCQWVSGGLPFTTNGEYVAGKGVLLDTGQWITAPYAPRYAVGFLSSSGLVFWVA